MKRDCDICPFKMRCCPKELMRKIPRSIYEGPRDTARALAKTAAFEQSRHDRKRVEMLFAHLKRILKLGRLRLRGPLGAPDEFTLAAIAQNLRRLTKLAAHPPHAVALCPRIGFRMQLCSRRQDRHLRDACDDKVGDLFRS